MRLSFTACKRQGEYSCPLAAFSASRPNDMQTLECELFAAVEMLPNHEAACSSQATPKYLNLIQIGIYQALDTALS